jgi:UDP-glucuronate 4-epimerase
MKVLVTGAAGFIGHQVARRLAETGQCEVLGIDNLSAYYDVELKRARLADLEALDHFRFLQSDFADADRFFALMEHFRPDYVAHLGAQPGVRHSVENPGAYVQNNLVGFANVLEGCRRIPPKHLVYASSSSVYGAGAKPPFREEDDTGLPTSFYGATKRSNELMAQSYAGTHGLKITGLRFFTVYGPWGRPDMAPTLFARAICERKPVKLFNSGKNLRDFTYVSDIVDGAVRALLYPFDAAHPVGIAREAALQKDKGGEAAGLRPAPQARIFNLGNHRPVETILFVRMIEKLLGQPAVIELLPAQPGEMFETCADLTRVQAAFGYKPRVPLEEGLARFVEWFRSYYKL